MDAKEIKRIVCFAELQNGEVRQIVNFTKKVELAMYGIAALTTSDGIELSNTVAPFTLGKSVE